MTGPTKQSILSFSRIDGLLRFARNDGAGGAARMMGSLAKRRKSNSRAVAGRQC